MKEYHPTVDLKGGALKSVTLPFGPLATEEGIFHFKNLSKHDFCTLPVDNIKPLLAHQKEYLEEGRRCHLRGVPVDRVYICNELADLDKPLVKEMMTDDANAGIGVYYILRKDIDISEDKIDFGIWDDSYVCTVMREDGEPVVNMDSSEQKLAEANEYKNDIMKKAVKWTPSRG